MIFNAEKAYKATLQDPDNFSMGLKPCGYFAGKAAKTEARKVLKESKQIFKNGERSFITHWESPIDSFVEPDWDFFRSIMLKRGFVVTYLSQVFEDEIEDKDRKTGKTVTRYGKRRMYRVMW